MGLFMSVRSCLATQTSANGPSYIANVHLHYPSNNREAIPAACARRRRIRGIRGGKIQRRKHNNKTKE